MSAVIHACVVEHLTRLRLRTAAEQLDACSLMRPDGATYLDFLDGVLPSLATGSAITPRRDSTASFAAASPGREV